MSNRLKEIPEPQYTPPISEEEAEAIRKQLLEEAEMRAAEKLLDPLGRELADPTPMEPPVGYNPQPTLVEQMRMMIQGEAMRQAALAAGFETFEEADDFEMDEDPFPRSPHEEDEFSPPTSARELARRRREAESSPSPSRQTEESAAATSGGSGTERSAEGVDRRSDNAGSGNEKTVGGLPSS